MNYARWTTEKELKSVLTKINIGDNITKSGIPMTYDDKSLYINDKESHTLVIASPGSGKTQSIMLPEVKLAIKAGETIIVNDIKGEIHKEVGGELQKEGYKTIILDLNNLDYGDRYNILSFPYYLYKNDNKDKALELIEEIGHYLLSDSKDTSDPFWENTAIDYFIGLTLYIFENAKEEEINLNSIFNLSNELLKDKNKLANSVMDSLDNTSSTYLYLSNTLLSPEETKQGIIVTFSQRLKKYVTKEKLSNFLSKTDFDIKNINKEKTAIFVISGTSRYGNSLLPILVDQIYYSVDMSKTRERRVNIILDEFDAILPIRNFYSKINYFKGLGIKLTALIKSFTDLKNTYGNIELIRMCFDNTIYLLANDIYTLEEVRKLCGNTEKGALVTIEDLKILDNFEAIILMQRMMPIKTKLLPNYKIDWNFAEASEEIPPITKEELKLFSIEK